MELVYTGRSSINVKIVNDEGTGDSITFFGPGRKSLPPGYSITEPDVLRYGHLFRSINSDSSTSPLIQPQNSDSTSDPHDTTEVDQ